MSETLSSEMYEALAALKAEGISFKRCSAYQLKVGKINFWPGEKGTILIDGQRIPEKVNGLEEFIRLSRAQIATKRAYSRPVPASSDDDSNTLVLNE